MKTPDKPDNTEIPGEKKPMRDKAQRDGDLAILAEALFLFLDRADTEYPGSKI